MARLAVSLSPGPESDRQTNRVGHGAGCITVLDQGARSLLHGGTQRVVLRTEIARDRKQVSPQLLQQAEQDAGGNDLEHTPGHHQAGTNRGSPRGRRKSRSDQQKDNGLLAYPTDARLPQGKHPVNKPRPCGEQHQDEVGVARDHADKGCSTNAQRDQDHGKNVRLINVLLGAKANRKSTAGSNQGGARMTQPDAQPKTDGYRQNKDEVGAEGLRFPIEDVAVGEERGGGRG